MEWTRWPKLHGKSYAFKLPIALLRDLLYKAPFSPLLYPNLMFNILTPENAPLKISTDISLGMRKGSINYWTKLQCQNVKF